MFLATPPSTLADARRTSVDVWWINLPVALCPHWHELLSGSENERAKSFAREEPLRRFVLRRIALRRILAKYRLSSATSLEFEYSPFGKPNLVGAPELSFNTSSSGDSFIVAVGYVAAIGVDLEKVRTVPELDGMIEQSCSATERAALALIPNLDEKTWAFFKLWTAKESILKMKGCGLSEEPSSICVAPLASTAPTPRLERNDISTSIVEASDWILALSTPNITPPTQYLLYSDRDLFSLTTAI